MTKVWKKLVPLYPNPIWSHPRSRNSTTNGTKTTSSTSIPTAWKKATLICRLSKGKGKSPTPHWSCFKRNWSPPLPREKDRRCGRRWRVQNITSRTVTTLMWSLPRQRSGIGWSWRDSVKGKNCFTSKYFCNNSTRWSKIIECISCLKAMCVFVVPWYQIRCICVQIHFRLEYSNRRVVLQVGLYW